MQKQGFTLIELLIVIAIIGILSSVVMASVNTVRTKARDTKRLAEVRQAMTALDLYHAEKSMYPDNATIINLDNRGLGSGTVGWVATPTGEIYIRRLLPAPLPLDGTCTATQNRYRYQSTTTQRFTLTFCLGKGTGGFKDINGDGRVVGTATEGGITVQ